MVLHDLAGTVRELAGLPGLAHVAHGARHDVFALPPGEARAHRLRRRRLRARRDRASPGCACRGRTTPRKIPAHPALLAALAESLPRSAPRRALGVPGRVWSAPTPPQSPLSRGARSSAQERDSARRGLPSPERPRAGLAVEVRETLFPADGLDAAKLFPRGRRAFRAGGTARSPRASCRKRPICSRGRRGAGGRHGEAGAGMAPRGSAEKRSAHRALAAAVGIRAADFAARRG